ncbi:hypothetical protein AAMO2058_001099900 [Amorphochlora amoebiformis]|mmetsp:Transcript_11919/g.18941  ORF Transcript_11919/g.18941 Transcript_11919/m.18941 type:complete len:386 (-) Transcript_11919:298-1455(-)
MPGSDTELGKGELVFGVAERTLFHRKSFLMFGILGAINLLLLGLSYYVTFERPDFFSLAMLAWTFGLRHAVDADHIAAIDNITRKLVQEGQVPVSVGLAFGMGHSLMVVVISLITVLSASTLRKMEGPLADAGRVFGTLISAGILLVLAAVNIALFISLIPTPGEPERADPLANGGCLTRCLSSVFRLVDSPWKMFILGLVFSLSFDTSTEVALLVLVASKPESGNEWPTEIAMLLPLLFTAGMTIIDAADGVGMAYAYAYGVQKSKTRRTYNLIITGMSAFIALMLGVVEVLQVLSEKMNWTEGWFWESVDSLDSGIVGYVVLALFGVVIFGAIAYEMASGCPSWSDEPNTKQSSNEYQPLTDSLGAPKSDYTKNSLPHSPLYK